MTLQCASLQNQSLSPGAIPTFDKNRSGFRQFQELSIG